MVIATGPFHRPVIPSVAGGFDPAVTQLHTADRNPDGLPSGPVLIYASAPPDEVHGQRDAGEVIDAADQGLLDEKRAEMDGLLSERREVLP